MKLSNQAYDILMWVAQLLLPGLGTLYAALSGIWGLPYGEQVVGTLAAVDVFLGAILKVSNAQYKSDQIVQIVQQTGNFKNPMDKTGKENK